MTNTTNPYEQALGKTAANHVALTPTSFLRRAAEVYPQRPALIYGAQRWTWAKTHERCCRLASALRRLGVSRGDTVSTMLPNVPAMYEAHFGVPMSGAVLNAMNVRLNADAIAFMLRHSETKVLLTDPEFAETIADALARLDGPAPIVIDVLDSAVELGRKLGQTTYEQLLASGDPAFEGLLPRDEWDAITLGYTSGTTGNPKGVVTLNRKMACLELKRTARYPGMRHEN